MFFKISTENRAKVLVALFSKAKESESTKYSVINAKFPIVRAEPSFYYKYEQEIKDEIQKLTLSESEAEEILKKNLFIGYIGPVKIAIDFRGYLDAETCEKHDDVIDTSAYDKANAPYSAKEILFKTHQITPFSLHAQKTTSSVTMPKNYSTTSYNPSLFMPKNDSTAQKSVSIKENIENILTTICGYKCALLTSDTPCIMFSEKTAPAVSKELADFLQSTELEIKYIPSQSALGGLIKTSLKIEYKCDLKTLLEKIQSYQEKLNTRTLNTSIVELNYEIP